MLQDLSSASPTLQKIITKRINEAQVDLQQHSWDALEVQENPSVLDLYKDCHLNKNKQEVLGRANSPNFAT
jgi:hypothetical protein